MSSAMIFAINPLIKSTTSHALVYLTQVLGSPTNYVCGLLKVCAQVWHLLPSQTTNKPSLHPDYLYDETIHLTEPFTKYATKLSSQQVCLNTNILTTIVVKSQVCFDINYHNPTAQLPRSCVRTPPKGVQHCDDSHLDASEHQGYFGRTMPLHIEYTHTPF